MSKKTTRRLVLLDSHAILHRAYHALPNFSTSHGEPTGALYGLSTMLIAIIRDLKPDYIAACFDMAQPTHRHEVFDQYKAGRSKADDELVSQIVRSYDIYRALNIPVYEKEGFEADDVIGTIVEQTKKEKDLEVYIASGDMDTLQLVDGDRVQVYTLKRGVADMVTYNEDAVRERYGFGPELVPDYKGLRGDPSDNIPGVQGIGDKSATALITAFGDLDAIYKGIEKYSEAELKEKGITKRTVSLLTENKDEAEFSKLLATIRRDAPVEYVFPDGNWVDELDMQKVVELYRELEFRSLTRRVEELRVETGGEERELVPDETPLTEREHEELRVATWVLNSNLTNPSDDDILHYTQAHTLSQAREVVMAQLAENNLLEVFNDIEKPLIPILARMHECGIAIDQTKLTELSETYHAILSKHEATIFAIAGTEFNINSPKQLAEVLFETLALSTKGIKKTGGGSISTAESELEKLRGQHEIIEHILEYRAFQKLLSTYIDNIPDMLGDDGRLHTTFLQHGTTTGRMSSQNPNLQNIPIKSAEGRAIREAFVASDGCKLVALDYSQIELRCAAILSGDEKLIDVFANERDVHTEVAIELFDVPRDEVDKEMRRKAKVVNFGILYGMGVNALKANLGGTRQEAQTYLDDYFATFSQLAEYIGRVKRDASERGYTETLFGRRRYFQGLTSSVPYIRAAAERMAVNAPIQGTSADITKLALIQTDEYLQSGGLQADVFPLLQVHDELIFEITDSKVDEVSAEIKRIMESVLENKDVPVPLEVGVSVGVHWGEL